MQSVLPAPPAESRALSDRKGPAEDAGRRGWRVLLVEADAGRRRKRARWLRLPGVEVVQAAHGPGALWALRARGADAAVVAAPAADELAHWLWRDRPDLRILVVEASGSAAAPGTLPRGGAAVRCDDSRAGLRSALRSLLGAGGTTPEEPVEARALRLHRALDLAADLGQVLRALAGAFGGPEGVAELLFVDAFEEQVLRLHRGVADRGRTPLRALPASDFALIGEARSASRPRLHAARGRDPALLIPLRRAGELAGALALRLPSHPADPEPLLELAAHAATAGAAALARLRAEAELRSERSRWSAVLDALADPVLVVDADHRVLVANEAALEAARLTRGASAARACFEICRPAGGGAPAGCPLADTVREGRPRRRELAGLFDSPDRRYVVSSFPLGSRHPGVVVHVYRDVTRERDLAEQVRLGEQMNAAGRLAATVAHEIRNPLAAMTNAVSLLRDRGGLSGDDARLMDIVLDESQRVSRIVGDFLSFARPLRLESVSEELGDWVETTAELLRRDPRLPPGLRLECRVEGPLPRLRLDRDKIRQLIWNLLLNAAEAAGPGGQVRIRAGTTPNGGAARLEVEDDGPGIPEAQRERIFEPFETTKAGGTGLGLPVSRHIAELHGGRVLVGDSELGGARLCVLLPAAEREH